jgi:predicted DNA-binding transcriptional regulator AlpA
MKPWPTVTEGTDHGNVKKTYTTAMTEQQVAEHLGLSVATLRAWRHRGTGPRFVRLGRAVRYLPSHIDEFIRASAVDTRTLSSSDGESEAGEAGV